MGRPSRPPRASTRSSSARRTARSTFTVAAAITQLGLKTFLWTVDPRDFNRPGVDVITGRVVGAVRAGGVVLMHDGGGDRSQTVAALPQIIATLQDYGYVLSA